MADIVEAGRIPLLVGGTMLYFKALLEGLSPLPSADPDVRQRIEQTAREKGWKLYTASCVKSTRLPAVVFIRMIRRDFREHWKFFYFG